ncbi:MAG: formate hydrogenlyase complex iron-sulfur subunit [Firmicutes bacterium ADurb.Bin419]|nr:MAG: formate hydrogenlyase complex iron-sulfur subunit [Firmicutes bacterium ADurb.Bin419]
MSLVSIVKCTGYDREIVRLALMNTFNNLGGVEKFIKPGMKVALKVNLVMKKKPEEAATTHPIVAGELARIVRDAGAEVIIVDSPGGPYTRTRLKDIYVGTGMEAMADEVGVQLNYDTSDHEVSNPDGKYIQKLRIIKPLVDADLIINVPKLKTHGQMVYTGAVKNMFGAIAGISKVEYHFNMKEYDKFADALIDIFLSTKPGLNIMDAVVGMEGPGPSAGTPKDIGVILASENAFNLDMTALGIVNIDPKSVPVLKNAIDRGLCEADLSKIECIGEKIENVKVNEFDVPALEGLREIRFYKNGLIRALAGTMLPKPVFILKKCIGCGECMRSCPPKAISMKNKKPAVELSKCIRCFCCQEMCPAKSIEIKRNRLLNGMRKAYLKVNSFRKI